MQHNRPAQGIFWGALIGLAMWPITLFCVINIILFLTGCANTPVSIAQTPEQKVFALYGEFVIAEETAQRIVLDVNTPVAIRRTIQETDSKAKPSADAMLKAFRNYETAKRTAPNPDPTPLNNWIVSATTDIAELITALKQSPTP